MKFAVLADLHLPDRDDTVKDAVLDWALEVCRREHVDWVIGAGDLTGFGTIAAAKRLIGKIHACAIPCLLTPGNAEIRSADDAMETARILATPTSAAPFLLLDSSRGGLCDDARAALREIPPGSVGVTHCPPVEWPVGDRMLLEAETAQFSLLIAGHLHLDRADGKWQLVRGLDPDKAIGGPPAVTIFTGDPVGGWQRREVALEAAEPKNWTAAERNSFLENLGISGMGSSLEMLAFAADNRVPCFELRAESMRNVDPMSLYEAVERWREHGGRILSMHLPDLGWCNGAVRGAEELRNAAVAARLIGCDRLTLHVPRCSVAEYANQKIRQALLSATAKALTEANLTGIAVGIENLHRSSTEAADETRGFGYTIDECEAWLNLLGETIAPLEAGFHFDIGHARNNAPFSSLQPIASWLAALGTRTNGCHLHQVSLSADGKLSNHMPILELYGPLISFSSLLLAWRNGILRHVPMFLEVRGGRGPESLLAMRRLFVSPSGV